MRYALTMPRLTGHILPILVTAECSRDVVVARLGQIVADSVTVADVPMAADVLLIPEGAAVQPPYIARGRWTGVPRPRRVVSFAVALHVDPDITFAQSADLTICAYRSIAAQVDAAHTTTINVVVLPLEVELLQYAARIATMFFRSANVWAPC
ncbi:hypothetical protein ACIRG5_47175 [Lentzea sp. NPDC102401]|uniref:hypothetical protein n=1 Tax=Lentzea sp. NPDC102401 TaxID=3364128 RepID=UPI003827C3E8